MMDEKKRPGYTFKVTADAIKISTRLERYWPQFILAILSILAVIAVASYWITWVLSMPARDFLPGEVLNFALVLVLTGLLILLSKHAVDNSFLQEDVEITPDAVTIAKKGFFMFKQKVVIPAKRIIGFQPTIQLYAQGSKLVDLFMNTSKIGKMTISTRRRIGGDRLICRGISVDEMVNALESIHEKYPQYW
jgi:hypothetical protein